jgi:flagellar M-ring protein FliF
MAEVTTVENPTPDKVQAQAPRTAKKTSPNILAGLDSKNMLLIGVALLAVMVLGGKMLLTPKYQTLYSNLDQSDAAAISSYLEKSKIKFQISPEGDSISVAGASVPKLRLDMASKGMPKGTGVGFEIFDRTNINISDFNQKINYNRALEGELARTISSLDSIKTAKVHLAIAKKSIFKNEQTETKASVVITPEFGAALKDEQIKGIQHLVASSVDGLDPQNVQITDQQGKSLVQATDENSLKSQQATNNDTKLQSYEKQLESDLQNMLSPILGDGNVLINVTAEMNFDESEMNIELYSPTIGDEGQKADPVVRSEKVTTEKYRNDSPRNFGTVGTQNNMPSFVKKGEVKQENRDYIKEDKTMNYEVSKSVERIRKASGFVKKVSVAVVVNKELSPSERSTLRQTVQVAAGLNLERGDQVIVTGIRFSSTPYANIADQEAKKQFDDLDRQSRLKKYISLALIVAMSIGIAILVLFSLTGSVDSKRSKEIDSILQEEEIPLLNTIDEKIQEAEEAYHRQLSLEGNRSVASMKEGLSQMAFQDPQSIARGLQAYIND